MTANQDMVDGYLDGRADHRTEYPPLTNRSASYGHGWLNGRDDRIGSPRDTAQNLRERAANVMAVDEGWGGLG